MGLFSKADLLGGTSRVKEITVKFMVDGEVKEGQVKIRPLSDFEYAEIQEIQTAPIKMNVNINTGAVTTKEANSGDVLKAKFLGDVKAVALGLVEPKVSETEVKEFPIGLVQVIAEEIYKISGVTVEGKQFLDSFR